MLSTTQSIFTNTLLVLLSPRLSSVLSHMVNYLTSYRPQSIKSYLNVERLLEKVDHNHIYYVLKCYTPYLHPTLQEAR